VVNTLRPRPADPFDAEFTHQAGDLVSADVVTSATSGLPELAGSVDLLVRDPQGEQHRQQHCVACCSGRHRSGLAGVIGARSDLGAGVGKDTADRLDTELLAVFVDVVDDYFDGRSSSAAKEAEADLRIEFARRSSLFSCSNRLIRSASSLVVPARSP